MPTRKELIDQIKQEYERAYLKSEIMKERQKMAGGDVESPEDPGMLEAASTLAQKGLGFGLRPVAAGAGAAAGHIAGAMERGQTLTEALPAAKYAYGEAREATKKEEDIYSDVYPKLGALAEGVGAMATAPLTVARGLKGALGAGALYGGAEKLSEGGDLGDVASGAAGGAGIAGAVESIPIVGKMAGKTKAGKAIANKMKTLRENIGMTASEFASNLTGVDAKTINWYAKNIETVEEYAKKYGEDFAQAADDLRLVILQGVQSTKNKANKRINKVLQDIGDDAIDATPIKESILNSLGQLNPKLQQSKIEQLTDILEMVDSVTDVNGMAKVSDIHTLKRELYDMASPAYMKPGQMFSRGKDFNEAARKAAREAKNVLDKVSPELAEANGILHRLHNEERKISGNLLKVGKGEAPLTSAARQANQANYNILKRIELLTNTPALSGAKTLDAMKAFGPLQLTPAGTTGYAASRMGVGGILGAGAGNLVGAPKTGAAIGALTTSPSVLKGVIKGGRQVKRAIPLPTDASGRGVMTRIGVQQGLEYAEPNGKDPSTLFIGKKGDQTKQAIRKVSQVPDDVLSAAANYGGTTNFFEAFNNAIGKQDLEPIMTSLNYLNSRYGFTVTRDILQSVSEIDGVITKGKVYRALSHLPPAVKVDMLQDFESAYEDNRPTAPIPVDSKDIPSVIRDISRSNISSVSKAKMINSLSKTGMMDPGLYDELVQDKVPRTKEPLEDKRYFQRLDTRR